MPRNREVDPQGQLLMRRARWAGAVYILYFLAALPLSLRSSLIVPSDAQATAAKIGASEGLYRLTVVTDLVSYVLYVALAYLLYTLLRHVSRTWAAIATLFTLIGCVVLVVSETTLAVPLLLMTGDAWHTIGVPERQELALLALKIFSQGYIIALFFFGAQWLVMGYLFASSKLVPQVIGYFLVAAGFGWVVLSVGTLLAPNLSSGIGAVVLPLGALEEIALGLWLLFKGVFVAGNDRHLEASG